MTWFAGHIVMAVKLKRGRQTEFPVWENIVLIQADSPQRALQVAEKIGRAEQGDDDGTFTWNGQPAEWIYAGVRKVTECALQGVRPRHGDEITYNEIRFRSRAALEAFAAGLPTEARHDDSFAVDDSDARQRHGLRRSS